MATKEQQEEIDLIIKNQKRELGLINEQLDLTKIEFLFVKTLEENFGDFSLCENEWKLMEDEIPVEKICESFASVRNIIEKTRKNEFYPYYEDEIIINNLLLGKTIHDMFRIYRIRTDKEKCPLCGSSIFEHMAALSRRDNKTEICSRCGSKEAVQDMNNIRD